MPCITNLATTTTLNDKANVVKNKIPNSLTYHCSFCC